jgi:hypothetical protein
VAATRIVKPIDVLEQSSFNLTPRLPLLAPNEFSLQSFKEGFRHGIIPTVSFAAHGYFERTQV